MDEEELRLKAVEISVNFTGMMISAAIQHSGLGGLAKIEPFGLVEDIELYVKKGILPAVTLCERF
jgi:hypothetical protein